MTTKRGCKVIFHAVFIEKSYLRSPRKFGKLPQGCRVSQCPHFTHRPIHVKIHGTAGGTANTAGQTVATRQGYHEAAADCCPCKKNIEVAISYARLLHPPIIANIYLTMRYLIRCLYGKTSLYQAR